MPEARYPTLEEFWKRLDARQVEPDLRQKLRERTQREQRPVTRVGEEATVVAVAARLVPSAAVPAKAMAAFLDETFDQQLGRADEQHGLMPRGELIPAGFRALDDASRQAYGKPFAELEDTQQDALLTKAEKGELPQPERFDFGVWFKRTREFLLLAYGSDPRGMVEMGFPGPSYKPGHIWLDAEEIAARAQRKPGYLEL